MDRYQEVRHQIQIYQQYSNLHPAAGVFCEPLVGFDESPFGGVPEVVFCWAENLPRDVEMAILLAEEPSA
jgi:hypothetical protein